MYLVHVLTVHNCTLDTNRASRYKVVARLQLFISFVPTPSFTHVVFVIVPCVTVSVSKHKLFTFHIERVCTVLQLTCSSDIYDGPFVLRKWAKFNDITRKWKLYQEFHARTHLLNSQSVNDPTQHEVVVPAPWLVHLWLVDANCDLCDSASTTCYAEPPLLLVPLDEPTTSIATLRQVFFGRCRLVV
jgi:hypothetical protein